MPEGDVIPPSSTGGGSITSDNSSNLVTMVKGLKKFDGSDPAEFKTWMKKFCVVVGTTRRDILPLLKNQQRPNTGDINALESYTRANEDLYAILFLLVDLPAALAVQKHEDDTGISGDGQAAFHELCNNYDRVTDEVIRAKMDEMENDPMNPGDNPDDYFNKKILLRAQLNKMGESVTDRRFKDICIQGITDEYNDVKLMVFRDPSFALGEIQSTMRNIFLDSQSRKGSKGRIAGRGFAMTTTTSDLICYGCNEPGHIRRNCPKLRGKRTKPAGATKWCSVHNTTSHSDEECYSQGAKKPETKKKPDKAVAACVHCNHYSAPTSNEQESSKEKAAIESTRDEEDGFENAFMFATCSRFNGREFAASETGVRLLVDTGASETMFDSRLIPDGRIQDYKSRTTPKIIDVAGEGQLQGTATGVLHCTMLDQKGKQRLTRLTGLIVPGLGRNIFSPTSLLKKGLRCVVEDKTPHLTVKGTVIPLRQDPREQGMCTLDVTFQESSATPPAAAKSSYQPPSKSSNKVSKRAVSRTMCSVAVAADTWHRRLGHINPRNMDILRKDPDTSVDYSDQPSPCGICEVGKHKQSPHPKKSTRKLSRPGQLVVIDNLGPVNPPAKSKGGVAESGGASDQGGTSDAAGDTATEVASGPTEPTGPSSPSGSDHSGGTSAVEAARSGMRRLEVTRASTRRKPTHDDPVDLDLVPGALTVTMNDDGNARSTARNAISYTDPAALTFDQLSTIAAQSSQPCPGEVEDFVHFPEDPFPSFATGYVYATRSEAPHGLFEETSQVLKIPNTYAEAMNSPQHEEWKGACANEMKSLEKNNVYTLVPLSSVPKTDKILGTTFVFKKKLDGRFKARLVVGGHRQEAGYDYGRSYAPVCRFVGAFLNAPCDRDVYVRPAPGESHKDPKTGEPMVGGLLNFGAKSQTIAAQSTVEAEIQAISYAAREAVYISNFMGELKFKNFESVPIHSDSTGALTVAGNAMHSQRTKHVALRYFFIRELVARGKISLHHRRSDQQLADIATKHLPKQRFMSILRQIQNFNS